MFDFPFIDLKNPPKTLLQVKKKKMKKLPSFPLMTNDANFAENAIQFMTKNVT